LGKLFVYNNGVIIVVWKVLYFLLLIAFFYFKLAFTFVVSFLKVTFFGL